MTQKGLYTRAREEFYNQNPEDRIDEFFSRAHNQNFSPKFEV
jgi:hypothetical protein